MRSPGLLSRLCYPEDSVCLLCGGGVRSGVLCGECARQLSLMRSGSDVCPRCGAPLVQGKPCGCDLPDRLTMRSAYLYRGPAADLVQALKFDQLRAAGEPLSKGIAELLGDQPGIADAVITWVTMPASRLRERSFDHAQLLAEGVAELLGLPCRRLLERPEQHGELRHQVGLSADQRAKNLEGTFICPEQLSGTVILIDDVCTTGSTLRVAADVLLSAGADQVLGVTACRAVLKK